jgi:hypothetical protein
MSIIDMRYIAEAVIGFCIPCITVLGILLIVIKLKK